MPPPSSPSATRAGPGSCKRAIGSSAGRYWRASGRRIQVRFAVPDEVASHLRIGSPVAVTADALGAKIQAAISKLHPQSSADARTFDVEAAVVSPSASLLLGMVVSVALQEAATSSAAVITAPLSSLVAAPQREREAQALLAFVVEEERGGPIARQRPGIAGQL